MHQPQIGMWQERPAQRGGPQYADDQSGVTQHGFSATSSQQGQGDSLRKHRLRQRETQRRIRGDELRPEAQRNHQASDAAIGRDHPIMRESILRQGRPRLAAHWRTPSRRLHK